MNVTHDTDRRYELIRKAAMLTGIVFLVVGVAGFIPGITTDFDDLAAAGPDSEAKLLGIFEVSILHNIVHLAFGLLGIAAAKTISAARLYLVGGGLLYLGLWLYGLVIDLDSDANFVPVNTADNWLHFALGVAMVGVGAALWNRRPEATAGSR